MPKFVVMIRGVNFMLREEPEQEPKLMGFYVNVFVETPTPEAAEDKAVSLVRASSKLRESVENPPDNRPRMFINELQELTDWPDDCVRPMSGFVFYEDPEEEWLKEHPAD